MAGGPISTVTPGFLEDPASEVPGVNPLFLGSSSWAGLGLCFLPLCALVQRQAGSGDQSVWGPLGWAVAEEY